MNPFRTLLIGEVAGGSNTRLNSQTPETKGFGNCDNLPPNTSSRSLAKQVNQVDSPIPNNRLEAHIDWLQFVGEVEAGKLYPLFAEIERLTKQKILYRPGCPTSIGYLQFRNSGRSVNSVRLGWDNQDENGKCYCLVSIPGKVLSAMNMRDVRELALAAILAGLHCTRLDDALDDWGKRLNPIDILDASEKKNYAKFKKSPRLVATCDGAWCIYFGSRESARSTKIYNKEAESKGRIKAYRLEVKFGSKIAHQVLLEWLMIDPDELGNAWERESALYLMRSAVGSIDFIDRENYSEEKNLSRIPRLSWWQAFIDLVEGEIYHTAAIPAPSLERTTKWHIRQTMRSLVCVVSALGEDSADWIRNQIELARGSLKERHIKLIEQFTQEYADYKANLGECFAY
jgi:hypothetical protein